MDARKRFSQHPVSSPLLDTMDDSNLLFRYWADLIRLHSMLTSPTSPEQSQSLQNVQSELVRALVQKSQLRPGDIGNIFAALQGEFCSSYRGRVFISLPEPRWHRFEDCCLLPCSFCCVQLTSLTTVLTSSTLCFRCGFPASCIILLLLLQV